jgi:hypothetical protein
MFILVSTRPASPETTSESEQYFSLPTFSAAQTFPMTNVVDQRAMMNSERPNGEITTQPDVSSNSLTWCKLQTIK